MRAIVAIPATPWRRKEGIPLLKMCQYTTGRRDTSLRLSFRSLSPRTKKEDKIKKLTHWLNNVAMAAPAIPISNTKIKMGSSTMFSTPPALMPMAERWALPCQRIRLLSTKDNTITGAPSRMYLA